MSKKIKKPVLREKVTSKLGPPPKASSVVITKVMKANKAKDTKPELQLRRTLWANNIRGYRLNWKKVPGSPGIAFPGKKIAIFVNGCFWHRCPICDLPLPKTNTKFWETKFKRNVERDRLKTQRLRDLGWKVIVIWECEIKKDILLQVKKVQALLNVS